MFQGLQLPEAFNKLLSNTIIYQSRNITNERYVSKEIAEIIEQTKLDETSDISESTSVRSFYYKNRKKR